MNWTLPGWAARDNDTAWRLSARRLAWIGGLCVLAVTLAPRSAYVLQGIARWGWQHSIAPTPALRYSVTFRTRRTSRSP